MNTIRQWVVRCMVTFVVAGAVVPSAAANDIHLRQAVRSISPRPFGGEQLIQHDTADVWNSHGRFALVFDDARFFVDTNSSYMVMVDHRTKSYRQLDFGRERQRRLERQMEVDLGWSIAIKQRPELYDSLMKAYAGDSAALAYFTKRKREYGRSPRIIEWDVSYGHSILPYDSLVAGYICRGAEFTVQAEADSLTIRGWFARTLDDQQASLRLLVAETLRLVWDPQAVRQAWEQVPERTGVLLAWERRSVLDGLVFERFSHTIAIDTNTAAPESLWVIPEGYVDRVTMDSTSAPTGK